MGQPHLSSAPARAPASLPWILVIDDEEAMRTLIEIILSDQGWNVQSAGGAEVAMGLLENAPSLPSLVICDVLMPKVDGLELTRRLLARFPGLKIMLISGHLTDISWWPTDMREHRFIAKPFVNAELVAAVREELAGSGLTD
jgi:DNA-binding NtrC family response regulator